MSSAVNLPEVDPGGATIAPEAARGSRLTAQHVRDYGIIVVFIVLFIVLSITSPSFLSVDNLLNIVRQNAAVGIIACAATVVVIGAGFDLSVGAVYFLGGVTAAWLAVHVSVPIGFLGGIAVGVLLGGFNGLLRRRWGSARSWRRWPRVSCSPVPGRRSRRASRSRSTTRRSGRWGPAASAG